LKLRSVDKTMMIQSSDVDLGEALPAHAEASILRVAGKYFGRLNTASAHFSREGSGYRCSVNIQMGALRMMSAEAQSHDIYLAFNAALEKAAKQLRRAKREVREDKAEWVDKDAVLREGMRPAPTVSDGQDRSRPGAQAETDDYRDGGQGDAFADVAAGRTSA
jgi:ribosomal subunit interface protein